MFPDSKSTKKFKHGKLKAREMDGEMVHLKILHFTIYYFIFNELFIKGNTLDQIFLFHFTLMW